MRALTLHRPWPALIVHAGKNVENRPWTTGYRGPFAIHAGKGWDPNAIPVARDWVDGVDEVGLGRVPRDQDKHPTGIVAVADLIGVCGDTDCGSGPWAVPGQCHWQLTNIRALAEPVPCRGNQGWWQVPPAALSAIGHHLGDTR
jgi:hypothetical protein